MDPRDAERAVIEPVRSGPGRMFIGRSPSGDELDAGVERVGGRRRIRGEIVVLVVGAIFVAGALLKPWPNARPVATPSAAPTAGPTAGPPVLIAQQSSGPAAPTVTIPPWEVRTTAPGSESSLSSSPGVFFGGWDSVDWSVLRTTDPHSGWGFTAAVMPSLADGLVGPDASSPEIRWIAAGFPPLIATLPLVQAQSVYAIAVTWPSYLKVSSISLLYLGEPEYPAYLPPAGFLPNTQVSPLPAARVASASIAPDTAGSAIRSGEFWITPSEASPNAASSSIPATWQSTPWPWPYGAYQVTVTSASGTTNFILDLQLTA